MTSTITTPQTKQPKELRYWKIPKPLTGNGFFYGRTDSGKSWKMIAIAQGYFEDDYKIWHLFGGKRKESCFWCFPSEEKKLWNDFETTVGKMERPGPKEYKVNILTFMFSSLLPLNKLPELLPRIKHTIVTIPFRKIKIEDITLVIGEMSSNSIYLWNSIIKETNKNSTGEDVKFLMNTKFQKYKDLSIAKNFIEPAIDNHLFSSEVCETNLNIEEEASNRDVVTVLNQEYIPEGFKWFIPGYLIRNIMDKAMSEDIHKRNIGICQEVSSFMKVQDKNIQGAEQTQIFRNQISDIARYARSGLFLFMDCQSPAETHGLISGQDDLMGINEMPSASDREALCEQLLKDKRISRAQVRYMYNIPIEQMVLVCRGQVARLIKRVMPPRTQCWKPTIGNFTSFWKNRYNSYRTGNKEMEIISNEYYDARITWELKLTQERQEKERKLRQANEPQVEEVDDIEENEEGMKVNSEKDMEQKQERIEEEVSIRSEIPTTLVPADEDNSQDVKTLNENDTVNETISIDTDNTSGNDSASNDAIPVEETDEKKEGNDEIRKLEEEISNLDRI